MSDLNKEEISPPPFVRVTNVSFGKNTLLGKVMRAIVKKISATSH